MSGTLAVVPARGGSKGLSHKNIRPLAGLPLLEHTLRLAALCPEIDRTVVSTDAAEIADVAEAAGAEVLERPAELARDDTPMLPVLKHALAALDPDGEVDRLLHLDPTSPGRLPEDVRRAHELLAERPGADGVVGVSEPDFNPLWVAVFDRDGYMEPAFPDAAHWTRRQDVPRVFRINASLYLYRAGFVRTARETWLEGRWALLEIPESRAFHIDSDEDLRRCELMLAGGLVTLPWLAARGPS